MSYKTWYKEHVEGKEVKTKSKKKKVQVKKMFLFGFITGTFIGILIMSLFQICKSE